MARFWVVIRMVWVVPRVWKGWLLGSESTALETVRRSGLTGSLPPTPREPRYLVFQRDFIGTFQDFFLAVLWGFTVDAGVTKLREMATPVLGRPVPLAKNEG